LGSLATVVGALVLLLPTLAQTLTPDQEVFYISLLIVESLVIVGLGVATRARSLIGIGAVFVGLAALRSGLYAVTSGVPLFLVIAAVALLLMGGATWLSIRARRAGSQPHEQVPVAPTGRPAE
jgi:hypothetical protein